MMSRFRAIVEEKRVFKFLLGLSDTLDDVRGRILETKPLPSLRAAFSEVRQVESRRKVMLAASMNASTPTENSALAVQRQLVSNSNPRPTAPVARGPPYPYPSKGKQGAGRLWCERCNKPNIMYIHVGRYIANLLIGGQLVNVKHMLLPLSLLQALYHSQRSSLICFKNCLSSSLTLHHFDNWYRHYSNSR